MALFMSSFQICALLQNSTLRIVKPRTPPINFQRGLLLHCEDRDSLKLRLLQLRGGLRLDSSVDVR